MTNDPAREAKCLKFGQIVAPEASPEKKNVIFDERSHYIYENKQNMGILPTQICEISTNFSRM
jgi:hypothetical protein